MTHIDRGNILFGQGRLEDAEVSYRRALRLKPDYALAHNNLANILWDQGRLEDSEASCRRAIQLKPDFSQAHNNLGNILRHRGKLEESGASYCRALVLNPDYPTAHANLGGVLRDQGRWEDSVASFRRAIGLEPTHARAFSLLADSQRQICDWTDFAETACELTSRVRKAQSIVYPFSFLSFSEEPEDQLLCARQYIEHLVGSRLDPAPRPTIRSGGRIRLGYVSADFKNHAMANQMAELFELHDRKRFEVFALSLGPDDQSPIRRRLLQAFDHFIDVRNMSDAEAAAQIRELGIDIAIDLNGYTKGSRPKILAHRPAPIQVSYLGYPGTMGADFIDYIIVDQFIVPPDQQHFYTEKLVYLPDSYQVNDTKRAIAESPPSRASCGLPESGFVFCCFNQNYKITPAVFDVWMRLLRSVPGSTLWLVGDNETAKKNLRREALRRDIEPWRLVFAPVLALPDHLARHAHADLFLDTLPYNAHATASGALWAGLPVLTCAGHAFPGRVAASLLHAIGLPELVTNSLEDYEALALRLASDPALLGRIRTKLNRDTTPLFDTNRFRLNIEAAYTEMWRSWESGQLPRTFTVQSREGEAQTEAGEL